MSGRLRLLKLDIDGLGMRLVDTLVDLVEFVCVRDLEVSCKTQPAESVQSGACLYKQNSDTASRDRTERVSFFPALEERCSEAGWFTR